MAAAKQPGKEQDGATASVYKEEAYYYAGSMRLLKGDAAVAKVLLQKCADADPKRIEVMSLFAESELRFIPPYTTI